MFTIALFEQKYWDDTIFCILLAKDALNRGPQLEKDLLDIQKFYFDCGDMFWVAIDTKDRVIGTIGTQTCSATDMWLKRVYVKPAWKRQGIGSALLSSAEAYACLKGITNLHVRFADDHDDALRFALAKGFVPRDRVEGLLHFSKILRIKEAFY